VSFDILPILKARAGEDGAEDGGGPCPFPAGLAIREIERLRAEVVRLRAEVSPGRHPPLFVKERFRSHAGLMLDWKIECDALSTADWVCLAKMASLILPRFRMTEGVPRGGLKFARALEYYGTGNPEDPILICDDVFTTGRSMEAQRNGREALGVVAFARGPTPFWVHPLLLVHPGLMP
jgi:hypothetical protein